MNVRIGANSLRFKISEAELQELLAGNEVREDVAIGESRLSILVAPSDDILSMAPCCQEGMISLSVSMPELKELEEMGRNRDGLQEETGGVKIVLQVDYRTQKKCDNEGHLN